MPLKTFSITVEPIKHQYAHNTRATATYEIDAFNITEAKYLALDKMGDYSQVIEAVERAKEPAIKKGTWLSVGDDDDGDDVEGGYVYIPSAEELAWQ